MSGDQWKKKEKGQAEIKEKDRKALINAERFPWNTDKTGKKIVGETAENSHETPMALREVNLTPLEKGQFDPSRKRSKHALSLTENTNKERANNNQLDSVDSGNCPSLDVEAISDKIIELKESDEGELSGFEKEVIRESARDCQRQNPTNVNVAFVMSFVGQFLRNSHGVQKRSAQHSAARDRKTRAIVASMDNKNKKLVKQEMSPEEKQKDRSWAEGPTIDND